MITAQANGKTWFHISMLHRIIENDDLGSNGKFEQLVDSVDTIRINCNNKERELAGDEYENEIISSIKNGENVIIKGPSKEEYTHSASYEGRRFP